MKILKTFIRGFWPLEAALVTAMKTADNKQ